MAIHVDTNTYNDAYNNFEHIVNGKSIRYVKLVMDPHDYEVFADILIDKLLLAGILPVKDTQTKDTQVKGELVYYEFNKTPDTPVDEAAEDIIVEEIPEPEPEPEPDPDEWKSYLEAYKPDEITLPVLLNSWKSFNQYSYSQIVAMFAKEGMTVSDHGVGNWMASDCRRTPRQKYWPTIKNLLHLTDEEFNNAIRNSRIVFTKARLDELFDAK